MISDANLLITVGIHPLRHRCAKNMHAWYDGIMYNEIYSNYNIDKHFVYLMSTSPFFSKISYGLQKVATDSIQTCAVSYDVKRDELCFYWSPKFFATLTDLQIHNVIRHEMYHIIFRHVTGRRRKPNKIWNFATDMAINSILMSESGNKNKKLPLPAGGLIPGRRIVDDNSNPVDSEMSIICEQMPPLQASEIYFEALMKFIKDNDRYGDGDDGDCGFDGEGNGFDEHDAWDEIPEEYREYAESKANALIEKAVRHADSTNAWGDMSVEMREAIRRAYSRIIDWKSVTKHFIGTMNSGSRAKSIKKINKKYPYIHAGNRRGHTAKLIIAIDQSGSVGDEMLTEFFSELVNLTKNTDVTILPFDAGADIREAFEWKRGSIPELKRTRCGGTDFNAPTDIVNDPKNRGRWDGLLIMTDGECGKPGPSRLKRGWIIGKGRKLLFDTDEIIINMDNVSTKGAWG
jgi:predicted metal-dependent peptidase